MEKLSINISNVERILKMPVTRKQLEGKFFFCNSCPFLSPFPGGAPAIFSWHKVENYFLRRECELFNVLFRPLFLWQLNLKMGLTRPG